jgi:hypothetical protein
MFTSSSSASRFTAGASPGESLDPQGLTLNRTNRTSLPALPLAEQKDQRAFDLVLIKVRPLAVTPPCAADVLRPARSRRSHAARQQVGAVNQGAPEPWGPVLCA